eukprot:scaffold7998_cov258-Pinguiococcus_pyrenoidosus.AAC.2
MADLASRAPREPHTSRSPNGETRADSGGQRRHRTQMDRGPRRGDRGRNLGKEISEFPSDSSDLGFGHQIRCGTLTGI